MTSLELFILATIAALLLIAAAFYFFERRSNPRCKGHDKK